MVTDTQGYSDLETVTITVNALPLFSALDYFPLQEGNRWDYIEEGSGEVGRSIVSGTKNIGGTKDTFAVQYPGGDKKYYTSDSNGMRLFGGYINDPDYTGDIFFNSPLLLAPNNAAIGFPENVSSSSYSIFGTTVDITARTRLLSLENVITQNRVLKNCIKASVQITQVIRGDTEPFESEMTYYWFYKGVGVVKQVDGSGSLQHPKQKSAAGRQR